MKRTLLSLSLLLGGFSFAQDCSEIFISEYLEGRNNNRALEIYNPTDATVDLSEYFVTRFSNGANSPLVQYSIQLSGTIAPKDVYVAVVDKRDPNGTGYNVPIDSTLMDLADGFYAPNYNQNSSFYWNGNDALALVKGSAADAENPNATFVPVDIFGRIGEDPDDQGTNNFTEGWTTDFPYVGVGRVVTTNYMMQRKSTILKGETNNTISHFNPLLEYDTIYAPYYNSADTTQPSTLVWGSYETLGSHNCDCGIANIKEVEVLGISIFPNPSNGNFTINGEVKSVNIINALGQDVVADIETLGGITKVYTDRKKGVYFVRIVGINGKEITERVIIK